MRCKSGHPEARKGISTDGRAWRTDQGSVPTNSDLIIHEYKKDKFTNGMMIAGFPSAGLVRSIAANFIIRTSHLERVAGIISEDFPPYTLVHGGVPSSPVRIYAGEGCKQLVTVAAEFVPRPELVQRLATSVMDYCQDKGIKTVVALEGINWQSPEGPKIHTVWRAPRRRGRSCRSTGWRK